MVVPIFRGDKHVASLIGGQLLPSPPGRQGLRKFLWDNQDLRLDPDQVREAYFRAPYLPSGAVDALLNLLSFFAAHAGRDSFAQGDASVETSRDPVARARDYIARHFAEPLSLADVASRVGLSPWYLSRCFRRTTGTSFVQCVHETRIAGAKQLLSATSRTVAAIAYDCGFNSVSQFNRTFRALESCSPGAYRRRSRQDD